MAKSDMRYAIRTSAICFLSSIVCRLSSVLKGILMTNKAPFCAFLRLKNPRNLFTPLETCLLFRMGRNQRLINDLRSTKVYVRKNNLFMQNKAKFRKVKFNVNKVLTRDYDRMDTWSIGTKQSQTKPNKAKFKKAEMNVTSYITKAYENKPPIPAQKKQSQISKRQKPIQPLLLQRIMKKTAISAPGKTNPNKAKQTQFQSQKMLLSAFLLWDLVRIIMLFKSLSGKCRLKVILEL